MQLPKSVKTIIQILENAGFEAYAVGGCVRDTLLGRTPNDWDITTNAKPEEVKKCFSHTIDTGIEHGTVTVRMDRENYEVTTFRVDGKYSDSRHPESVTFTANLAEDLKRRDFTINAMAYSDKSGVVDLYNGREDLKNGVVRAVGVAKERFTEDALRIMRCVRFAAQLGFSIEPETFSAAKELAPTLKNISVERIREELVKTLMSVHPEQVSVFDEIGAFESFYPEYRGKKTTLETAVAAVPCDKVLRLAAFLFDSGETEEESNEIASRVISFLKFDNATRYAVLKLVAHCRTEVTANAYAVRQFLCNYGKEDAESLLTFRESVFHTNEDPIREEIEGILERGECTSMKELRVTGKDLISAGVKPGPEMGDILAELLAAVLENPSLNDKDVLLGRVSKKNTEN